MKAQFIEKNDRPEWAVVPYEDYRQLVAAKEMLDDVTAFDAALAADEEEVPHAVVRRLIEGRSPIRVWREHRGLTQQVLAARAGIAKAYLSQLESGKRTGSSKVLAALAAALDVAMEDLLDEGSETRDEPEAPIPP